MQHFNSNYKYHWVDLQDSFFVVQVHVNINLSTLHDNKIFVTTDVLFDSVTEYWIIDKLLVIYKLISIYQLQPRYLTKYLLLYKCKTRNSPNVGNNLLDGSPPFVNKLLVYLIAA